MVDNIRLLEERVLEAVDRLERLTAERDELREEIDALRERLDAQKREASRGGRSADSGQVDRGRALSVVRQALSELRGG